MGCSSRPRSHWLADLNVPLPLLLWATRKTWVFRELFQEFYLLSIHITRELGSYTSANKGAKKSKTQPQLFTARSTKANPGMPGSQVRGGPLDTLASKSCSLSWKPTCFHVHSAKPMMTNVRRLTKTTRNFGCWMNTQSFGPTWEKAGVWWVEA